MTKTHTAAKSARGDKANGASGAGRASGAGGTRRAGGASGVSKATGAGETKPARKPRLPKAVATAVSAALDKKAVDIVVLDLRKAGGFTDYFVIATGLNSRQIRAIAEGIEDTLRTELAERPALSEGVEKSEWILLDYFNFVVHIFSRDCRAFYGLEKLWGNAERHEYSEAS